MTNETAPQDLASLSFEDYAEEYVRQQSKIRRGIDFLTGLVKRPPALFSGLMPERTITMLSAEPSCGKTMLTLAMSLSLNTLQPLMGRYAPRERKRVFFLGQDAADWDYAEQFRKLARGMGVTAEGDIEVDFLTNQGGSFTDRRFLAELQQWHDITHYEVVIFDTLASFHDFDENDTRQMGAIMAILKRMRDVMGCSVIFTHHTRKPMQNDVTSGNYRARGSTVIPGSIDFHIALQRLAGGRIRMTLPKARGSEKLSPDAGFTIVEGEQDSQPFVKLT